MPSEMIRKYLSCPCCKRSSEIEIILKCGHVICKDCKKTRNKCPSCLNDLDVTRKQPPSVKFIENLYNEFIKTSSDNDKKSEFQNMKRNPDCSFDHPYPKKSKKIENKSIKPSCSNVTNKGIGDHKSLQNSSGVILSQKKMLGGLVDENELLKRYLKSIKINKSKHTHDDKNSTANQYGKNNIKENNSKTNFVNSSKELKIVQSSLTTLNNSCTSNKPSNCLDDGLETLEENDLCMNTMLEDMLNNYRKEIIVVGNSFCASQDLNDNHKAIKSLDNNLSDNPNERTVLDNLNKTENLSVDTFIEISDSEEDIVLKNSDSPIQDENIKLESNLCIKNCKVVIENSAALLAQSAMKDAQLDQETPVVKQSPSSSSRLNDKCRKKILCKNKKHSIEVHSCDISDDFDGFTEQDIFSSTVKFALFKMNSKKFTNITSTSSLFTLHGKQILIKDVSEEEVVDITASFGIKGSVDTIEISDSEDESTSLKVSSAVQTDNDLLAFTPIASTSKLRPVSIPKFQTYHSEMFDQKDVLDTSEPFSTPLVHHNTFPIVSNNNIPKRKSVSRRQLSFKSPATSKNCEFLDVDKEAVPSSSKKLDDSMSVSKDNWQSLHYSIQHTLPKYTDDPLKFDANASGFGLTRLTFTTCHLNSKETVLVTKLARLTNSCLSQDFTHETTHLIIGTNGRGTLDYYLAIAYRAFIVTMDWVSLCVTMNKILPVTGFIPTEDEGPSKCLEPISLPFVGFHVCTKILPTVSGKHPIAEITKTLLSLGGAKMFSEIDRFQNLQDNVFPRFLIYGDSIQITQDLLDKCASLHVVPIQSMWVYESIRSYKPLPIMDYLGAPMHCRTLIRDYRVSEQLACSRYPRLDAEFCPKILDERYQRSL